MLSHFGSDYYGLNATILQILIMLQVVEAGILGAAVFALYKPITDNKQDQINMIYTYTRRAFIKIGLIFSMLAIIVSFVLPIFIITNISYFEVVVLFIMAILPTSIVFLVVLKYHCLFNSTQQEYIPMFINIFFMTLSLISAIIVVSQNGEYLLVRGVQMVILLSAVPVIAIIFKKKFPDVKPVKSKESYKIKGSYDIIIIKIVGILMQSLPIVLIAIFFDTYVASLFGVYVLVVNVIRQLVSSVHNAPHGAFGLLFAEGDMKRVYKFFSRHTLIVTTASILLFSVAATLIVPFISLYTVNVADEINYINLLLGLMLISESLIRSLGFSSGMCIFVSGNFKACRNILGAGLLSMLLALGIGIPLFGIYGIAGSIIIGALVVSTAEIIYAHQKYFSKHWVNFLYKLIICLISFIGFVLAWWFVEISINNFWQFIKWGFIVTTINASILALVCFTLFNKETRETYNQFFNLIKRKKS